MSFVSIAKNTSITLEIKKASTKLFAIYSRKFSFQIKKCFKSLLANFSPKQYDFTTKEAEQAELGSVENNSITKPIFFFKFKIKP